MGLASSQARLLTLTSRLNDLEMQCQTLSMQKLRLTAEGGKISREYNAALKAANEIGPEVISLQNGSETLTGSWKAKDGSEISFAKLITETGYTLNIDDNKIPEEFKNEEDPKAAYQSALQEDATYFLEQFLTGNFTITGKWTNPTTNEEESNHKFTLEELATFEASRSTTTTYSQQLDYSARNAERERVQNEYDAKNQELQRKEQVIDMQMQNANTEYQAATTEYESLKNLLDKNAERSFSLFN